MKGFPNLLLKDLFKSRSCRYRPVYVCSVLLFTVTKWQYDFHHVYKAEDQQWTT